MKKDLSIIILGLVVVITPFLGIPTSWKNVVFVVVGFTISVFAYLLQKNMNDDKYARVEKRTEIFVENGVRKSDDFAKTENEGPQDNNTADTKKE